jgi:hypothetical protein
MVIFIPVMKRCLIILITFCSLLGKVYGQSPSAAIDSLVKYQVITGKEKSVLQKDLKDLSNKSSAYYRIVILGELQDIMLQKKFHVNPRKTGIWFSYSGHLDKKRQDSVNASLRPLLEKLKKADLLTDRVYGYAIKGIDSGSYMADMQMVGSLTEMSSRLESLAPGRLLPFVNQLHKSSIISDSSFTSLGNDIKDNKIESIAQLINYCRFGRTFDLGAYPGDQDVWLEQIHRDIATIVPGLNFTDFSYAEIPDTSFSLPGVKFKVSLKCNGRTYKHTSLSISNYKGGEGKISPKDIVVQDFYRIFNKVLTDQQSPLRLHSIMFGAGNNNDYHVNHFSLIALSQAQGKMLMQESIYKYMIVSRDDYDSTLTSARIDSTLSGWQKMGLFAHLSNTEFNKALDDAEAADPFSDSNLLSNFPGVVYNLHDTLIEPAYPYVNMLKQFAKITHGTFSPTKIVQSKVKGGFKLQYLFKDKMHSYTFPAVYGWMDGKFKAFMKDVSLENNLPGNFYLLRYEDAVIYLTKQQHEDALKYKLLDLEPATRRL